MKRHCQTCGTPHSGSGEYCQAHQRWSYQRGPQSQMQILNEKGNWVATVMRCKDEEKIARQLAASPALLEAAEAALDFFVRYILVTYSEDYREEMEKVYYDLLEAVVNARPPKGTRNANQT